MLDFLIDMLQCPNCQSALEWEIFERRGNRIELAQARCPACKSTYPVREGIGLFLTPDLPRNDLWEQVDSNLAQYLRENPGTERRLMGIPAENLPPADRFFRAMVLEERGQFEAAAEIFNSVDDELYTAEYLDCQKRQFDFVIERLAAESGPVVDLASGRGALVRRMLDDTRRLIVMTDFSPNILRRDRRMLEHFGLYHRTSLLAFDARRTPFKDGAVSALTTYMGLANIEHPESLLKELRRIVSGEFLAVHHFYPPEDVENRQTIEEIGLDAMLFRSQALESFRNAGWQVRPKNICTARARPTPVSELLEGAGLDLLPVTKTQLEWCTLVATESSPPEA